MDICGISRVFIYGTIGITISIMHNPDQLVWIGVV